MRVAAVLLVLLLSACAAADSVVVEVLSGSDDGAGHPLDDVVVSLVSLEQIGPGEYRIDTAGEQVVVRSDGSGRADLEWDAARPFEVRAVYRVAADASCYWIGRERVFDGSSTVAVVLDEVCE